MNLNDRIKVYNQFNVRFGTKAQLVACVEELAELQVEVCKKINNKKELNDHLIDEIADVSIMLEQLINIFSLQNDVNERIDFKIKRMTGII